MGRQIAIVFVVLLFMAAAIDLVLKPAGSPTARATPSPTPVASANTSPKPSATPSASITPRPTYVPTPAPPPIRVSGSGSGNSYVFRLNDSQGYVVSYSLPSACQYYGELRSTDGTYDNTDFIQDTGPTSGNKQLTYPLSGTYYVAMTAHYGCQWSLVFWPR